jgi:hypothetical protein
MTFEIFAFNNIIVDLTLCVPGIVDSKLQIMMLPEQPCSTLFALLGSAGAIDTAWALDFWQSDHVFQHLHE